MDVTLKTLAASALAALTLAAPAAASTDPERIVRFAPGLTPAAESAAVVAAGGELTRDLPIIGGAGVRLSAAEARRLARDPRVVAVDDNAAVHTTATRTTTKTTNNGALDPTRLATAFNHSARTTAPWSYGFTGRGVGVAVIDTGVAGNLPDFRTSQSDATSRVVASAVVNPNATTAGDTFGHGTHVAGLIAGNGFARAASDPLYGKYAGTAPGANIVSVKVSDEQGASSVIDVINGLQFAVDHRATYNIRVVNLSLNSSSAQSYMTDALDAAVQQAWRSGLVVVAAAGNRGTAHDAVHYAPANDPYALTVGGIDDRGTKDTDDDRLTSWTSRGTTQDGFVKPEVRVPGAHLVGPLAPNSRLSQECPSCVVSGAYLRIGGTSMAAAVASGIVADILQANPTWTPDQVKAAMIEGDRDVYGDTKTAISNEVAADSAIKVEAAKLPNPNAGLTPHPLLDPATGLIDYTKASWSKASWSGASDLLRASWSRASWSCSGCSTASTSVDPNRASWSRASWSWSPTL